MVLKLPETSNRILPQTVQNVQELKMNQQGIKPKADPDANSCQAKDKMNNNLFKIVLIHTT